MYKRKTKPPFSHKKDGAGSYALVLRFRCRQGRNKKGSVWQSGRAFELFDVANERKCVMVRSKAC